MTYLNHGWGLGSARGTSLVMFQGFEFLDFAPDIRRASIKLAAGFRYHTDPDLDQLILSFQVYSPHLYRVVDFCQWARVESGLTYPVPNSDDLVRLLAAEGQLGSFSWAPRRLQNDLAPYALFLNVLDEWEIRNPP